MYPPSFIQQLSLPVVAAPMFLVSGPELVVACCRSGIIGSFPALNRRSSAEFEAWLELIEAQLREHDSSGARRAAPYAVNLIVHHSNPRVEADLEICIKYRVPLVITSLGIRPELIDAVHAYGGLVYHDVIKRRHAEKAAQAGVDGLILVAAGAGGHAGTLNPLSLVSEIRSFYDKTLLLSGCISTGRDIAAALQMGADMAYMGTRFINTRESMAPREYREMIIESGAGDIVYTAAVSGVQANFMRASLEAAGLTPDTWGQETQMDFGRESSEARAWKTIWSAGQGACSVQDVLAAADLVDRLKQEFREAVTQQSRLLDTYPN